jgi:hypothetical protein
VGEDEMSIDSDLDAAENYRYEVERRLAEILAESTYLAADQHNRRARYLMGELECSGYVILKRP